jgi:hypothetical protein
MKLHVFSIFILAISLTFSGCFSFTNFQTARTVGKDKTELGFSINALGFSEIDSSAFIRIPTFEFGGKYGITENIDVGVRLSNFGTFLGDFKYQFYGDKESMFAAATGISLGASMFGFSLRSTSESFGFYQFDIPLHLSVHPSEVFAFYFTPRYIGLSGYKAGSDGIDQLMVFSPGIEFGKRLKVILNYNLLVPFDQVFFGDGNISQFGIGFKFKF